MYFVICNNLMGDIMEISTNLANQIINNIKDIINQDLNFMDTNGYIIASTDPLRVNTFHEASKVCVKKKRTIIIEYDNQYYGSKKGINIPVYFDGNVTGVIGITGERDEVEKYGTIIKKMTEILMKEEWIKENAVRKRDNQRNLLEGLIYGHLHEYDNLLQVPSEYSKYFVVSQPFEHSPDSKKINDLLNVVEKSVPDKMVLSAFLYQELVLLFSDVNKENLIDILLNLKRTVYKSADIDLHFGISTEFHNLNLSKQIYEQAKSALSWQKEYLQTDSIVFFDEMDLGILLSDIPLKKRNEFSNKVLNSINDNEYSFYHNLINIYSNCNCSINKVSDKLFMHKNSIQYRLNRLHELTGYNPREINDFVILKLAFLLSDRNPDD